MMALTRFSLRMAALAALATAFPAEAGLVLSQVILDVKPGEAVAQDIEVWNNSSDRAYVVANPSEVVSPGQAGEHRATEPDPSVSGILVTPQRMILEAGQRRLIRVGLVLPRGDRDRIYRIAVQPVAGEVSSSTTALKVMIGYDVLVIYRPQTMIGDVTAKRMGNMMVFTNAGNTNVEMFEGRQCDASGSACKDLPSNRLYAGASWQVPVDPDRPVQYRIATAEQSVAKTF